MIRAAAFVGLVAIGCDGGADPPRDARVADPDAATPADARISPDARVSGDAADAGGGPDARGPDAAIVANDSGAADVGAPDGTSVDAGEAPNDDTFGCLDRYTGPLVTVSGTIATETTSDSGYDFNSGEVEDETRFDARDATFLLGPDGDTMAEGVAFNFSSAASDGDSVCVAGGVYRGVYDRTISWAFAHDGDGMLMYLGAPDTTIDGVRGDNIAQDAPGLGSNSHAFVITNSWLSYVRDDCLENDDRRSGRITDNLYDGCYTFLSHQLESDRDGSSDRVVVERNLIRMQNMPKPYDYERHGNDPNSMGHGDVFKQATGPLMPTVDVIGNVFYIEPNETPRASLRDEAFEVELGACRDNLLLWPDETDSWPDPTWEALPAGCIAQVVRGAEATTRWNAIRQNWIDCHPRVGRVPGDPASDPSRCRTDAYGGGQGGTALP